MMWDQILPLYLPQLLLFLLGFVLFLLGLLSPTISDRDDNGDTNVIEVWILKIPTRPLSSKFKIALVIIGALMILLSLIGVMWNRANESAQTTSQSITYQVRVQDQRTGEVIKGAHIIVELGGMIPVDKYTDANGLVSIEIDSSNVGGPGKLIIKAKGYETYEKFIAITESALPETVRLVPIP